MDQYEYFDIAFDSEKGQFVFCIYDIEGDLCRYCILEDRISIQVAKYEDIKSDLLEAQKAINEMIKIDGSTKVIGNEVIIKALFDYVIILIVKCFNSSTGRKTSLDFKKIFKFDNDLLSLFEQILEIRNNQIAHSGDYQNALVLYFDPTTNDPIDLRYSHIKKLAGKQIILYEKLIEIVSYILKEVEVIKNNLYEKLISELKAKGITHYYSLSKSIDKSSITTTIQVNNNLVSQKFASQ